MNQYRTIVEWLDSNPPIEIRDKVSNFIQRCVIAENRKELDQKTKEHKKINLAIRALKEAGLALPNELVELESALYQRILFLEKHVPPPK